MSKLFTVSDSRWHHWLWATIYSAIIGILAYQIWSNPNAPVGLFCLLIVSLILVIGRSIDIARHPRQHLMINEVGIYVSGYGSFDWTDLRSYFSVNFTVDNDTTEEFIFETNSGLKMRIDLATTDSTTGMVRQFIHMLPNGTPIRDLGESRHG